MGIVQAITNGYIYAMTKKNEKPMDYKVSSASFMLVKNLTK